MAICLIEIAIYSVNRRNWRNKMLPDFGRQNVSLELKH